MPSPTSHVSISDSLRPIYPPTLPFPYFLSSPPSLPPAPSLFISLSLSLSLYPFPTPSYTLFFSFPPSYRYEEDDTRCQLLSLITPPLAAFKILSKPSKNPDLNSVFTKGFDTGYGVPYENALYVPAREGYDDGKNNHTD